MYKQKYSRSLTSGEKFEMQLLLQTYSSGNLSFEVCKVTKNRRTSLNAPPEGVMNLNGLLEPGGPGLNLDTEVPQRHGLQSFFASLSSSFSLCEMDPLLQGFEG